MAKQEQAARSQQRAYTVVSLHEGDFLKVLHPGINARSQKHACDQVVEALPVKDRKGRFGAFLAGSYREFGFTAEQTVVMMATACEPSFIKSPGSQPSSEGSLQAADAAATKEAE